MKDSSVVTMSYHTMKSLTTTKFIWIGYAQRKTQYKTTTDLYMRVDGLRPYTKYEFSVMINKDNRNSIYSLATRNRTLEDSKLCIPM